MNNTYETRNENTTKFNAVTMPAIARALGGSLIPAGDQGDRSWCRTVNIGDGQALFFRFDDYKNRIEVSGHWPKSEVPGESLTFTPSNYLRDEFKAGLTLEIGVAADKAPEKIVTDIRRRLIPSYVAAWDKLVEYKHQHEARCTTVDTLGARLASILGSRARNHTGNKGQLPLDRVDLPSGFGFGGIEIRETTAFFKMDVTHDQAVKLAEFLKTL